MIEKIIEWGKYTSEKAEQNATLKEFQYDDNTIQYMIVEDGKAEHRPVVIKDDSSIVENNGVVWTKVQTDTPE